MEVALGDKEAVVFDPMKSLVIEVIIKGQKWLFHKHKK